MEVSESECNIVNATTELNYDDHIKLSANVKEASYFNIFECGRNILGKLDVTYQREFAASEKPSSVPPSAYIYPLREKYWDIQAKLLTERMAGMDNIFLVMEMHKLLLVALMAVFWMLQMHFDK